jgi:hypothetical protein
MYQTKFLGIFRSKTGIAGKRLRWILEKWLVRIEGGWKWLRIVYNGRLWYQQCRTFGFC